MLLSSSRHMETIYLIIKVNISCGLIIDMTLALFVCSRFLLLHFIGGRKLNKGYSVAFNISKI